MDMDNELFLDGIHVLDVPVYTIMRNNNGDEYIAQPEGYWKQLKTQTFRDVLVESYVNTNGDAVNIYEHLKVIETNQTNVKHRPSTPPRLRQRYEEQRKLEREAYDQLKNEIAISQAIKPKRGRPAKEKRCTREATTYNLFVKQVMPDVKIEFPQYNNVQRMKECARLWRDYKATGIKLVDF